MRLNGINGSQIGQDGAVLRIGEGHAEASFQRRMPADFGEPSGQVIELSTFGGRRRTAANGGERRRPREGSGMRGLVLSVVSDELCQVTNGGLELRQVLGDCCSHDRV